MCILNSQTGVWFIIILETCIHVIYNLKATLTKLTFIFLSTDLFQNILSLTLIALKEVFDCHHTSYEDNPYDNCSYFLSAAKNTFHTPLPVKELELLQAGIRGPMGNVPEDGDHTEVQLSVQLFNL